MAFVKLTPVGHSRESVVDDLTFKELRAGYAELEAKLTERRREVREGWGAKYAARVHEKHKMTCRLHVVQGPKSGARHAGLPGRVVGVAGNIFR